LIKVTGLFNFARIHNLNGSIVVYANNPIPQPTPTTVTNRTEAEVARILSPYTSASIPVIHTVLPIDLFIIDSKTMPEVSDHLIISETVLSSPMNNQYYHLNTLAKTVTGTSRDIHSLSSSYPAESNVDVASTIMIIALFIALIMQIDLIAISTMLRFIKNIPANNLRLLARALTAANEKNIKTETAHPAEGMPINNSTDIAKLLEGGQLPEGYTISPFIIIPGTTASCIVTDPSRRIAIFTATGVKRKSTVNF